MTRSYQYDAAGRPLCEIAGNFGAGQTCDSPGLNLYVRNFYDGDGFAGGAYAAGRLTQRVGYNPTFSPTTTVTDQFTYSDAGRTAVPPDHVDRHRLRELDGGPDLDVRRARVSSRHTASRGRPGRFALTFGRSFGLRHVGRRAGAAGRPSRRPMLRRALWPRGPQATASSRRSRPTISLIPRASRIQTSGAVATAAGGNFDSGIYRYDGAGNVVAMGSDAFGYDARSRLTSAIVPGSRVRGVRVRSIREPDRRRADRRMRRRPAPATGLDALRVRRPRKPDRHGLGDADLRRPVAPDPAPGAGRGLEVPVQRGLGAGRQAAGRRDAQYTFRDEATGSRRNTSDRPSVATICI